MMTYIMDTSTMRELLVHFRRSIFEKMWAKLETMIKTGEIVFVKESYCELERQFTKDSEKMIWIKEFKEYFLPPSNAECEIVVQIYTDRNFQNNVAKRNMLEGLPVADPFIVAKASINNASVVSREIYRPHAAKIPNLCEFLGVTYVEDEDFQRLLFS